MPRRAEPTPDPTNVRIHDEKSKQAIRRSLESLGAGRSILLDASDVIVAGNGVHEQARALGLPIRVVESDGTELIAVRRTDLATEDERRKALAVADNRTGELSFFDNDALSELLADLSDRDLIQAAGFTDDELASLAPAQDILGGLADGDFSTFVGEGKETFGVTFNFAVEHRERMQAHIREHGKETLAALILAAVMEGEADA
ncbi:MAG: hypothetical protein RBU25_18690 [Lentisphaeria bacterium]|jgi:hypothetical protein|nr:hypothetical protein [Lentisphaeria bacterium]